MTIYGLDISSFQKGLDLAAVKKQGYSFIIARCVMQGNQRDPEYQRFMTAAKKNGLLFAAYVFPWTGIHPSNTAAVARGWIGDPSIPIMIDWENDGSSVPSYPFACTLYDELKADGLRPWSIYTYRPYWQARGSHDFRNRPWRLVNASYGTNPRLHGTDAYPGKNASGWNPYGGLTPTILQFGSRIIIDGYNDKPSQAGKGIDANAYEGTLASLRKTGMFKDFAPKPAPTPTIDLGWIMTLPGAPKTYAKLLADIEKAAHDGVHNYFVDPFDVSEAGKDAAERTAHTVPTLVRKSLGYGPLPKPVIPAPVAASDDTESDSGESTDA